MEKNRLRTPWESNGMSCVSDCEGGILTTFGKGLLYWDDVEADYICARLLAASPEMLETLEAVLPYIGGLPELQDKVKIVIKKATLPVGDY